MLADVGGGGVDAHAVAARRDETRGDARGDWYSPDGSGWITKRPRASVVAISVAAPSAETIAPGERPAAIVDHDALDAAA